MKNIYLTCKIKVAFIVIIIIFIIAYFFINKVINSRRPVQIPRGFKNEELLNEFTSPNGTYTIKTYFHKANITVVGSVRAELIINSRKDKPINIYLNRNCIEGTINWADDNTVFINGIKIDLPNGFYDYSSYESKDLHENYINEYMDDNGKYIINDTHQKRIEEKETLVGKK